MATDLYEISGLCVDVEYMIMGVGAAKSPKSVKWSIAIDMVKTWVLTFPGCGILGFACAKLFLMIL